MSTSFLWIPESIKLFVSLGSRLMKSKVGSTCQHCVTSQRSRSRRSKKQRMDRDVACFGAGTEVRADILMLLTRRCPIKRERIRLSAKMYLPPLPKKNCYKGGWKRNRPLERAGDCLDISFGRDRR